MIKLFTHTDLDGIGCAIVGKVAYDDQGIDIEYCDYNNVNEKIRTFLVNEDVVKYRHIFITDITPDEETAKLLNTIVGHKLTLLDHHTTAEWLNDKYPTWANVYPDHESLAIGWREGWERDTSSGTSLFFEFLRTHAALDPSGELYEFVEAVRQYDTWEWSTKFNNEAPKQLSDLLYIYGRERFIDRFLTDHSVTFQKTEQLLLDLRQEEIDRFILDKNPQITVKDLYDYKVGFVFADRFQSELGNKLIKLHPELDIIAMIDPSRSISYRSAKDNVNCGAFAKRFGGGGRERTAGSPVTAIQLQRIIRLLFMD